MTTEAPKLHAGHMEVAVARLIGWQSNTIVPNVYWGLGLRHEADLLVLDQKGRFTEIEIKVSKSDLKADFKKGHSHESSIISRMVFAVPESLVSTVTDLAPKKYGIISVQWNPHIGVFRPNGYAIANTFET